MRLSKVTTADGSLTFHDACYDETHHSRSGALEEADKKYAKVCGISGKEEFSVLDICFGLGYNSAAAIDSFTGNKLKIVCLEIYSGIVDEIVRLGEEYPFKCREVMQKLAKQKKYENDKFDLTLIMGDARETIKDLPDKHFDAVFLDPFSPKKCPELWTEQFFKEIYRVLKKNGRVATYSCARIVRDNFKLAGFTVQDGPIVGRRGPGTLAIKD
jgi:tRNA U34 5-methylaminomethyl-2-thiouridine-forming methyltransferase MnmC